MGKKGNTANRKVNDFAISILLPEMFVRMYDVAVQHRKTVNINNNRSLMFVPHGVPIWCLDSCGFAFLIVTYFNTQ